jgi:hypothetical protein
MLPRQASEKDTGEKQGKRDKNRKGNHFLDDFQLPQGKGCMADAVCGHLEKVFKQGDTPACEGGDNPRPVGHVAQMAVPGEGHENVAYAKQ